MAVTEGTTLWTPSSQRIETANLTHYTEWAAERTGRSFSSYDELWRWSTTDLEGFWASLWDYFDIRASMPYDEVLADRSMPGARWFTGARLSFAEHIFRAGSADRPAIVFSNETEGPIEVSWRELEAEAASVAAYLRSIGVEAGDRVVSFMPNIPQTVSAFLGAASIGAVWSSCSPDFGSRSVIDRFRQVEPKVLFAVDGYRYGGTVFDRRPVVAEIQAALPSLEATIFLPYVDDDATPERLTNVVSWAEATADRSTPPIYDQLDFDHPLWIVYTSGTTGLPKPIVHGQGSILLEQLKLATFHFDLGPSDRFFWTSSTGWIMWNLMVGTMLTGATVLPYDGNFGHPDLEVLWRHAERTGMTFFGVSAAYVLALMSAGVDPKAQCDLSSVRTVGSTGSPLPPEGFAWLYEQFGDDTWVVSASGGTDIATTFVGGTPTLPVRAGEIQCRSLGAAVAAYDEEGKALIGRVGELVVTEPMPSMPLYLWNDEDGARYRSSYYDTYPGAWRHGDWIKITPYGSAVITGRSDSTINRKGVRIGSSELYSVVEEMAQVSDSLVIDVGEDHNTARLMLFVVLSDDVASDDGLIEEIASRIRTSLSPRHVPDELHVIDEVPRTLNGKKLEVPIKRLLQGTALDVALSVDSMSNPDSIRPFLAMAGLEEN